ncbi:MAG: exosortase B [Candidatus Dactylopiibacterium carminicum]|uniref:Exosortase B n=1 Tax=Candidatus Dactylopiibacterium carminicum TaxID=857335 RepID=A0A272EP99_9RHOO|nr:exosortase B [Candidatus Dactylopiibacterium carminicum]KAF7598258.1 exosortase B [Candidatus Dactylopiibacterium carminicum]PAS91943.1 MAG: exosortase B [Candidatus Dactylopiibacterium carminicum]PAS97141.1 MAG: exosortase B [Candidatus Dactylopiibacterium carminicum]
MSAVSRPDWRPWALIALGLAVLYIPSFWGLFHGIWATEAQAHGPIVLAIACWLIWKRWPDIYAPTEAPQRGNSPRPAIAWPLLALSALLYALGRSQGILIFEIGSLIGMLIGSLLLLRGPRQLVAIWFGLFFMLFMIPLPGAVVDALTQPMKLAVSNVTEAILYQAGYPIARSGVILQIGQYQLLVADACAGLQTLFTLEAMGLLYLNLVRHASIFRNVTLAILIVPISFAANVIRVTVLSLITYHLGDAAGQGFLHGFAGMVLFLSALLLIIAVDRLLRFCSRKFTGEAV